MHGNVHSLVINIRKSRLVKSSKSLIGLGFDAIEIANRTCTLEAFHFRVSLVWVTHGRSSIKVTSKSEIGESRSELGSDQKQDLV